MAKEIILTNERSEKVKIDYEKWIEQSAKDLEGKLSNCPICGGKVRFAMVRKYGNRKQNEHFISCPCGCSFYKDHRPILKPIELLNRWNNRVYLFQPNKAKIS